MDIRRIVANIPSRQIEKSKEFYGEFLGMKLAMDMGWILTFVSASNPTAQISIVQQDSTATELPGFTISIEVADVDALYKEAVTRNYKISRPPTNEPWGVRRFFLEDPNGVTVNIMCHL
jgi:predicted enzyme related to lactoylglutathione lyase